MRKKKAFRKKNVKNECEKENLNREKHDKRRCDVNSNPH